MRCESAQLAAMPDWSFETKCARRLVAGVDEAGRGPAAGPVVAAAVIFEGRHAPDGLDDSKKLTPKRRERLFDEIMASAQVGVGVAEPEEIDRINLLRATLAAMSRAVAALPIAPEFVLIDGDKSPALACPSETVISGDARSISIAAASVIAKVTRDRLMVEADLRWPGYGFAGHKGYLARVHQDALRTLGPCPIHRRCFAPVREASQALSAR